MPKVNSELTGKLAGVKLDKKRKMPLWQGPESSDVNGGVTQSMLGGFLGCRERFRLRYMEGLSSQDTFNHRIEYGNMWHACEETFAKSDGTQWADSLKAYCQKLLKQYPLQQEQVIHYYEICKAQFPIYVKWWSKHPDVKERTPLLQEEVFCVPYKLFSGRTVYLRGKWDSVDVIGKDSKAAIWLQENKSKGDIDQIQMKRQLRFDLQTMMYLVALGEQQDSDFWNRSNKRWKGVPIGGVRYNVIRRPLAGGKGSIRQHQPSKSNPQGETSFEFYKRLGTVIEEAIEENGDHYFFMRWKVDISLEDIAQFKRRFLNPILENLCQWYDWINSFYYGDSGDIFDNCIHWQFPFGTYNVLAEGGSTELDECIDSGNEVGLRRVDELFTELKS